MSHQESSLSPARFILLTLTCAVTAIITYTITKHIEPNLRYIILPVDPVPSADLPSPWDSFLPNFFGQVRWIAVEMLAWLFGGFCLFSTPIYLAASAYRGACLGYILSLLTAPSMRLTGHTQAMLLDYLVVTVILILFACEPPPSVSRHRSPRQNLNAHVRYCGRFFFCTGLVFCTTLLCRLY